MTYSTPRALATRAAAYDAVATLADLYHALACVVVLSRTWLAVARTLA